MEQVSVDPQRRAGTKLPARLADGLIADLLADQQRLTAVDNFSRAHARLAPSDTHYRDLVPFAELPAQHQFAFEVDLDRCSGCKACVTACHSLNGLDDGEAWREVGALVSDDWQAPFRQTVTTACHHCVDPGCLNGCPVLAYEKDPATGIVRHLDDQCIGCQYCTMTCPYEVPKYSTRRGIVRKCDLCYQRLTAGEAPACAEACPNTAIRIIAIDPDAVRAEFRSAGSVNSFLPGSPNPAITLPTTRYVSQRPLPATMVPGDAARPTLQPPHWPLVWMLVLTQLSVGALSLSLALPSAGGRELSRLGLIAGLIGLVASVAHLGKPLKAWRSFLGWKRSWLSREIMMFGAYIPAALAMVIFPAHPWFPLLATVLGCLGVFCSGMVYRETQRAFWRGSHAKFFGSTLVLGLACAWAVLAWESQPLPFAQSAVLAILLAAASVAKLACDYRILRSGSGLSQALPGTWPRSEDFDAFALERTAQLLRGPLGGATRLRFACGWSGGVFLPLLSLALSDVSVTLILTSLALCIAGELLERYTFFRGVVPPRMPGNP